MAKLIMKCPYIKGNSRNASHLQNYVSYIGTREGARAVSFQGPVAAPTQRQKELADELSKAFPLSKGQKTYQEYEKTPTGETAFAYIEETLLKNADAAQKKENYISYIANRPRAEKQGTHALFTAGDQRINLAELSREIAAHPGNIWLPILSLRREDAERLGYDNAEAWRDLLASYAPKMAREMKIPVEQFRWYAAFHDEGHHPHVHMVFYSADGHSGYLNKKGIENMKRDLASEIFQDELLELYTEKGEQRDTLVAESRETFREMLSEMKEETLDNERIEHLTEELILRLQTVKGKKQYGYLRPELKNLVDEIVDELAKDPRIATAYERWYELREEVLHTYRDKLPERLPLSKQAELKQIRNMVIREAVAVGEGRIDFEDSGMDDEPGQEREASRKAEELWKSYDSARRVLLDDGSSVGEAQEALRQLEALASKGFSPAAYQLGLSYREGLGVLRDWERAEQWLFRAAELKNSAAEYSLGKLFEEQKQMQCALAWYVKAAEHGESFAQYRLGKLYAQGRDVPQDLPLAQKYFTQAAEGGNPYAQYALGKLYLGGSEIPRDRTQAERWLGAAAAQGHPYASMVLERIDTVQNPSALLMATKLMVQLAKTFELHEPQKKLVVSVDRKLREKIRRKKIAMGHKEDDHEDEKNNIALVQ